MLVIIRCLGIKFIIQWEETADSSPLTRTPFAGSHAGYTTIWAFSIPRAPAITLPSASVELSSQETDSALLEIVNKSHTTYQDLPHRKITKAEEESLIKLALFSI